MDKIKTTDELNKIIDELSEQGFSGINRYELELRKKEDIIRKANTHNISKYSNDELKNDFNRTKSFEEMENIAKEYFSKFSSKNKLNEYLDMFDIIENDQGQKPSKYDYEKGTDRSIKKWEDFKNKWGIPDIGDYNARVYIYDLNKNYIKVRFPNLSSWDFKQLYNMVFNEEAVLFNERETGNYQNIGKLELKFYSNGNVDIKGSGLNTLKKLYKNYIPTKHYINSVILYGSEKLINEREPNK
jgi:hypothetical protein